MSSLCSPLTLPLISAADPAPMKTQHSNSATEQSSMAVNDQRGLNHLEIQTIISHKIRILSWFWLHRCFIWYTVIPQYVGEPRNRPVQLVKWHLIFWTQFDTKDHGFVMGFLWQKAVITEFPVNKKYLTAVTVTVRPSRYTPFNGISVKRSSSTPSDQAPTDSN